MAQFIFISSYLLIFCFTSIANEVQEYRFNLMDHDRERQIPVKVYYKKSSSPVPVILFSHGLGGSCENNAYLGNYWANANYFVIAVQHAGSDTDTIKNAKLFDKIKALKEAVSPKNALARFKDIPFVLDQLENWNKDKNHIFKGSLNLDSIGMSGHSYGAITSLALAGSQFNRINFLDERIDTFFAMSPKPSKISSLEKSYGSLKQPFLCMTGTKDVGTMVDKTLKASDREKVYEAMPNGDKYQLVLEGGEHHSFGDNNSFKARSRNPKHHPAIQKVSLQFWDAYLKQNSTSKAWLQMNDVPTKSGLSSKDKWSWK